MIAVQHYEEYNPSLSLYTTYISLPDGMIIGKFSIHNWSCSVEFRGVKHLPDDALVWAAPIDGGRELWQPAKKYFTARIERGTQRVGGK